MSSCHVLGSVLALDVIVEKEQPKLMCLQTLQTSVLATVMKVIFICTKMACLILFNFCVREVEIKAVSFSITPSPIPLNSSMTYFLKNVSHLHHRIKRQVWVPSIKWKDGFQVENRGTPGRCGVEHDSNTELTILSLLIPSSFCFPRSEIFFITMVYSYSFKGLIHSLTYTNPHKFYSGAITAQFSAKIHISI